MGAAPYGLLGNLGGKVNFGSIGKYNKSGSNLQSSANIIVRTSCMTTSTISALGISNYTPHPGNDGYCVYQIKSNKTVSTTDSPYTSTCTSTKCGQPGCGVLVTGANVQDVTQSTAVSLMGGGTLQLQGYDNSEPGIGNDTLTIQVTDNSGRVWFSNSWTGTKTALYNSTSTNTPGIFAPIVNGGKISAR